MSGPDHRDADLEALVVVAPILHEAVPEVVRNIVGTIAALDHLCLVGPEAIRDPATVVIEQHLRPVPSRSELKQRSK